MDIREIRKTLKKSQPRLIKLYLIPEMWFDEREIEPQSGEPLDYWIFHYAFYSRFPDDMIAQRLGFANASTIYRRINKIIENNKDCIKIFLSKLP